MPRIEIHTRIAAPPQRCFDLARDLDLHLESMDHTGERAVAGKTSGLIGAGEEVTWCARHFGIWHEHRARITAFDPPRHFRDEMVEGRFAHFRHDHHFDRTDDGTRMTDVLDFASPLGPLGALVDRVVLGDYLRRLLEGRNALIRRRAERGS